MLPFVLGVLAYLVPTFALGFVWHLILFKRSYAELAMYRSEVIVPFGFLSMLIQALIFAWLYQAAFAGAGTSLAVRVALYSAIGAALSWSFTTLAVAAKNVMASVPRYMRIETAFTAVQWLMVGPLTVLAFQAGSRG
jgi:hypothetical protein